MNSPVGYASCADPAQPWHRSQLSQSDTGCSCVSLLTTAVSPRRVQHRHTAVAEGMQARRMRRLKKYCIKLNISRHQAGGTLVRSFAFS